MIQASMTFSARSGNLLTSILNIDVKIVDVASRHLIVKWPTQVCLSKNGITNKWGGVYRCMRCTLTACQAQSLQSTSWMRGPSSKRASIVSILATPACSGDKETKMQMDDDQRNVNKIQKQTCALNIKVDSTIKCLQNHLHNTLVSSLDGQL